MRIIYIILSLCLLVVAPVCVEAQISEEAAREELNKRGISEEEVKKRLLERGIDLDNINANDPTRLLEIEDQIAEVIAEIEQEKKQAVISEEPVDVTEAPIEKEEVITVPEEPAVVEASTETVIDNDIYGHGIFKNKSLQLFKKSDNIKPTDAYILGVGDEIGISIWGYSQESQTYEIDQNGFITPFRMEPIYLSGLTYGEAKVLLERRFQLYYRFEKNEFKATLSRTRDLSINIYGEVEDPGSYSIAAQNTAFNALVAAGGPSDIGSVRNIKLIKPGAEPRNVDIYEYLANPGATENYFLEENDIIHVPIAERIVDVRGAVIRESKYELIAGEDLVELFEYTGGFKANAILQNIQVKRYVNDEEKIFDVDFNTLLESNSDFELLNGDFVFVRSIQQSYDNFVDVSGAVAIPGKYAITNSDYLHDLLRKIDILPTALSEIAYIKRFNPDGKSASYEFFNLEEVLSGKSEKKFLLRPRDQIIINQQSRFADDQNFNISGAVREPGQYQIDESGSISFGKALFLAGGLRIDATDFAYIKRKKFNNENQIDYIRVDFEDAESDDLLIQNGDDIVVYSSVTGEEDVFVNIEGAVRNPGKFVYSNTLTLRDVLSMSGGFKISAAPYKVDVYRLVFDDKKKSRVLAAHLSLNENFEEDEDKKFALHPFDQIYVREAPEFEFQKTVNILGEIRYKGKYPILEDNETLTDIVARAGGLTDEAFAKGTTLYRVQDSIGYIVIDLEEALKNHKSHFNLHIQDGDVITVPKSSNIVTIVGETRAKDLGNAEITNNGRIHAPFEKGKSADYYIQKYAGGIGENGSSNLITVTFPTGDVKTSSRFLFFKKYPEVRAGSVIEIGNKKLKDINKKSKSDTDWGKVLTDSVAQATAILSLVLLIQGID